MNEPLSYSAARYSLSRIVRQDLRTLLETLEPLQAPKGHATGLPLWDACEARLSDLANEARRPAFSGLAYLAFFTALHHTAFQDLSQGYFIPMRQPPRVMSLVVSTWKNSAGVVKAYRLFNETHAQAITEERQSEGYGKDTIVIRQTLTDLGHVLSGTFRPRPSLFEDKRTGAFVFFERTSDTVLKQLSNGTNLNAMPSHPLTKALSVLQAGIVAL